MSDITKTYKESKQEVIDRLWLIYFNDTLYEKGLISETDRNRMRIRINSRTPHAHSRQVLTGFGE